MGRGIKGNGRGEEREIIIMIHCVQVQMLHDEYDLYVGQTSTNKSINLKEEKQD